MSLCCDKDTNKTSIIVILLIMIALITGYFTINMYVKYFCMVVVVIFLITLIITQNGGYEEYMQNPDDLQKIDNLKMMLKDIVPEKYLNIPVVSSNESYTFKKKKIFLCLKDFDYNTIVYVYLHELAHAKTEPESDPHSSKWKKNFDEMLNKAIDAGIYDPIKGIDKNYMKACGEKK